MKRTNIFLSKILCLSALSITIPAHATHAPGEIIKLPEANKPLVSDELVPPTTEVYSSQSIPARKAVTTPRTLSGIPDVSDIDTLDIPYYDRLGFDGAATLNGSAFDYTISHHNGQLVISQTDVSLSGNGLPIVVNRNYRSRTNVTADLRWSPLGFGWDLHFGRLKFQAYRLQDGGLCHQPSDEIRYNPLIEMPDYSVEQFYGVTGEGEHVFRTVSGIIGRCNDEGDFVATTPGGIDYTFDLSSGYLGGDSTDSLRWLPVTHIEDLHGNQLNIRYETDVYNGVYPTRIEDPADDRYVQFNYDTSEDYKQLVSLTYPGPNGTNTIRYTHTPVNVATQSGGVNGGMTLDEVILPEDERYRYTYHSFSGDISNANNPDGFHLKSVTLPVGNSLTFDYQATIYNAGENTQQIIPNVRSVHHENIGRDDFYTCYNYSQNLERDYAPGYTHYDVTTVTGPYRDACATPIPDSYTQTDYFVAGQPFLENSISVVDNGDGTSTLGSQFHMLGMTVLTATVAHNGNLASYQTNGFTFKTIGNQKSVLTHNGIVYRGPPAFPVLNSSKTFNQGIPKQIVHNSLDQFGNPLHSTFVSSNAYEEYQYTYLTPTTTAWHPSLVTSETLLGASNSHGSSNIAGDDSVTTNVYDAQLQLTDKTINGITHHYRYNRYGLLEQVSLEGDILEQHSDYHYGVARHTTLGNDEQSYDRTVATGGYVTSETDARGSAKTYTYDDLGRVSRIGFSLGNPVDVSYQRNVIHMTRGPLQQTLTYTDNGQLLCHEMTGENETLYQSYQYLLNGQVSQVWYPNSAGCQTGPAVAYDWLYDLRLERVTYPDGNTRNYSYNGTVTSVQDENGNVWQHTRRYGSQSTYEVRTQSPIGTLTAYAFNRIGQRTRIIQGTPVPGDEGQIYTKALHDFEYNDHFQLTSQTSYEEGTRTYTYHRNGLLASMQQNDLPAEHYAYDGLQRLIATTYSDATLDVEYRYDGSGNLVEIRNGIASRVYDYDLNNNLISLSSVLASPLSDTQTVSYEYDQNDQLSRLTYPGGLAVDYAPDAFGRPTQVGSYIRHIRYHPSGAITQLTYGNGQVQQFSLDPERLWSTGTELAGKFSKTAQRDAMGNLTAIQDSLHSEADKLYRYDRDNRLLSSTGYWGNQEFGLDSNSNITGVTLASDHQISYYISNRNIPRAIQEINGGVTTLQSITADAQGRIEQLGDWRYQWNQRHNLVSAQSPSGKTAQFHYDGHNGLVARQNDNRTERYLRDDQHKVLASHSTDGEYSLHIYLNGQTVANLTGSDTQTETVEYIHSDLAMNPIMATDASGQMVWSKDYDPYGNEGRVTGDGDTRELTFHHHQRIADAGLVYVGARWYSPRLRRFISPDPVGVPDAAVTGVNRFHYGLDNPLAYTDPDGRISKKLRKLISPFVEEAMDQINIRNKSLAGKRHEMTGVPFDERGYPDFSEWIPEGGRVELPGGQLGNHTSDFDKANKIYGVDATPEGYTWHHHQDGKTMELVPQSVHNKTAHTGGVAVINKAKQIAGSTILSINVGLIYFERNFTSTNKVLDLLDPIGTMSDSYWEAINSNRTLPPI
ncbi:HNH endonuclease [Gynuella sunshinyii]|uniref:Rhs family protein n=1 Tax=Gynuella sunshinyii YC6258 TaxID=1445510 RepID=A0A0C5V8L7_9GAMM|nr:HNH endonuclease [Gynuella sunshinyii]AJQ95715.1 rhs family protein [Gynuella sunshinyii YC6258]